MTSYQANFASHILATAMLVSCSCVKVLGKVTKCSITFYLAHTALAKLKPSDKNMNTYPRMEF